MSLNIKNEETVHLVRKLAALKGVSLVTAVTIAVQDKLAQENAEARDRKTADMSRYDLLMAYADEFARRIHHPAHSHEVDGLLYGEDGLPR